MGYKLKKFGMKAKNIILNTTYFASLPIGFTAMATGVLAPETVLFSLMGVCTMAGIGLADIKYKPLQKVSNFLVYDSLALNISYIGKSKGFDFGLFSYALGESRTLEFKDKTLLYDFRDYLLKNYGDELSKVTVLTDSKLFQKSFITDKAKALKELLAPVYQEGMVNFLKELACTTPERLKDIQLYVYSENTDIQEKINYLKMNSNKLKEKGLLFSSIKDTNTFKLTLSKELVEFSDWLVADNKIESFNNVYPYFLNLLESTQTDVIKQAQLSKEKFDNSKEMIDYINNL